MIVYIESNFVLELALEQEQCTAAQEILTLAEQNQIKLVFPNFILSEPFESIARGRRERKSLVHSLNSTLKELCRSEPHRNMMPELNLMLNVLNEAHLRQLALLHTAFNRLLNVGTCANVNALAFNEAQKYQPEMDLSPQDSIIYATIMSHLRIQPRKEHKCFLSRDMRAFDSQDDSNIKAELAQYNCRYVGSFIQGLNYIQHRLKTGETL